MNLLFIYLFIYLFIFAPLVCKTIHLGFFRVIHQMPCPSYTQIIKKTLHLQWGPLLEQSAPRADHEMPALLGNSNDRFTEPLTYQAITR